MLLEVLPLHFYSLKAVMHEFFFLKYKHFNKTLLCSFTNPLLISVITSALLLCSSVKVFFYIHTEESLPSKRSCNQAGSSCALLIYKCNTKAHKSDKQNGFTSLIFQQEIKVNQHKTAAFVVSF